MMDFFKYGGQGSAQPQQGTTTPVTAPATQPGNAGTPPAPRPQMGLGLMQGLGNAMQGMAKAPGMPPKFGEMFNKSPFSPQNMANWADKLAERRTMMEERIQTRRAEMAAKRQAFQDKMKANPGMAPWGRMGN